MIQNGDKFRLSLERDGKAYSQSIFVDDEDTRRYGRTVRDVAARLGQAIDALFGEFTRMDPETGQEMTNRSE